jgi:molybdopterin converting factor small subunit
MIQIHVRLYATLRRYQPRVALGQAQSVSLPEGGTTRELAAALGIPPGEVKRVFVNGHIVEDDHRLADGDEVGFFPPVAGG